MKNSRYSMMLGCVLASGAVMAQVSVWQGGAGDWSDGANWNNGVPTLGLESHIYNNGGGEIATVTAPGAKSARVVMENGASLIVAAGADLEVGGQILMGNALSSVGSTITVDGGTFNQGTVGPGEFYLGANLGGASLEVINSGTANLAHLAVGNTGSGLLSIDSGTVNVNGAWLISGYNAGGTGNIVLDGGALNTSGTTPLHLGWLGHGTMTVNDGTVTLGNALNVGVQAGSQGDLIINGGTMSVAALAFGSDGTQTLDLNGGQLITTGGFTEGANSTFYIGSGELIFNGGQSLEDVQGLVSGSNWIFDDTASVYDSGSGIVVTSIPEPATLGLIAIFGGAILGVRRFQM